MNINDKIREVAKETEALVKENERLEESLRKQRHLKDEYKQMAEELQAENERLEENLRIQRHLKDEYKQIAHEAIMKMQDLREPKDGLRTEVESIAHTLNSLAHYLRVADESVLKQYSLASDGDSSTEELVLINGMTVIIERESN